MHRELLELPLGDHILVSCIGLCPVGKGIDRDAAGCSDAVRVGTGGAAGRRGQSCIGIMAGPDGQRAMAVTGGRGKGAVGRLCDELEGHGRDRTKVQEAARDVCSCAGRESAAEALGRLCSWIMHSNVSEMKTVARTLRKEREGILNWCKRGSTNSFLEGLSSVAQSVRSAARGFRSIACFRTMIFLRLGRLDFTAQKELACATH